MNIVTIISLFLDFQKAVQPNYLFTNNAETLNTIYKVERRDMNENFNFENFSAVVSHIILKKKMKNDNAASRRLESTLYSYWFYFCFNKGIYDADISNSKSCQKELLSLWELRKTRSGNFNCIFLKDCSKSDDTKIQDLKKIDYSYIELAIKVVKKLSELLKELGKNGKDKVNKGKISFLYNLLIYKFELVYMIDYVYSKLLQNHHCRNYIEVLDTYKINDLVNEYIIENTGSFFNILGDSFKNIIADLDVQREFKSVKDTSNEPNIFFLEIIATFKNFIDEKVIKFWLQKEDSLIRLNKFLENPKNKEPSQSKNAIN
ncbi:hypothetical protein EDEG_00122 [Edhazardia aedis USNM 41457]|uniref:Uncharacterized protein n=1 Tax=Edhazardia aedis (strain USNM 41457) TaxID=1003232 RepID=J9DUC9_EDHAE|nr:hypothetical protein EDEG_00122 [Edhazardia aedis USNM 41457]|eukprot:EJW04902.1 hypothetical protein EDEG_00122 [Edhazardia aedis USNM 41457]